MFIPWRKTFSSRFSPNYSRFRSLNEFRLSMERVCSIQKHVNCFLKYQLRGYLIGGEDAERMIRSFFLLFVDIIIIIIIINLINNSINASLESNDSKFANFRESSL